MGSIFVFRILLRLGHFVDCHFVAIMMETLYFEGILFLVGAPGMGSRVEFDFPWMFEAARFRHGKTMQILEFY